MAKNITRHVQHIKSVDTTTITVDGQDVIVAKLPEWGDLKDGEIAVNYNDGYETISIRNNNNEVVAFPNINTVNTLIDEKAQAALTFDTTPTANSTNPVTSGGIKTYVDNGDKIQTLTTYQTSTPLAVGDTHDQALSKLSKIIDDNETTTARALTDLNDNKQDKITDLSTIRAGAALGATALQAETQLSKGLTTGSGNVVTDISVNNHQITLTKGATALTEHQSIKTVNGNTMVGTGNVSVGTITGITMNNASKGTSGVVDLGTVITSETQLSKGTTTGDGNAVTDISVDNHQITLTKGATFLVASDVANYADGAEYDSTNHLIYLKHGNTRLANPINAADFIKDGMVDTVVVTEGNLVITFNTDSGKEDIEIPLTDIFDPSLYYTKEEIDEHELVTAAALTELHDTKQELLTFDNVPTSGSSNPVTSSGIKNYVDNTVSSLAISELVEPEASTPLAVGDTYDEAFAKLSKIIRDNELATAGALTDLHNTKQELLTFDSTPTANSQNPVTSEGIKEYVDDAIDASTSMTDITYSDLVTARNNNSLKPGTWYRITDYTTTTTQANTQSAGHNFDVIVLATSSNTLSEEARAIQHSGDTYFANSKLNAWKVWYCLDNDTNRFAWADDSVDEGSPASIIDSAGTGNLSYIRNSARDEQNYFAWEYEGNNIYTETSTPSIGDTIYLYDHGIIDPSPGTVASYTPPTQGTGPNGRGVIYRLVDEFNNDIKYDFKNIQFKRTITDGQYDANGTETWCYTLNLWYQGMCQDASIVGNTLPNDDGFVIGVYDNKFGYATAYDLNFDSGNTIAFALGDNVILSFDVSVMYYGIYSNTIGNAFTSNTIGNDFYSNTIGNDFTDNTIGNDFTDNTIGNNFYSNTIGNAFTSNTIGNSFYSNAIGNDFYLNTIGNDFYSNTIGNSFYSNAIGNDFYFNTIGNDFNSNTIGNDFYLNTIGNDFYSNTIGNSFYSNAIGNDFYFNTIGYDFNSNTIGIRNGNTITTIDHVRYIRVEDGVKYVDITTSATTNNADWLQNITIAQGVRGTSSTRKVITHGTLNDTFRTTYQPANSDVVSV